MHILIPHFILNRYAEQTAEQGTFPAAAIFVDASGFTAATEALMQHGQHGAEVMANLMTDIFAPLVESIYQHGGFVAGFAGDAFTAIFPITTTDQTEVSARCMAAATAIQAYMQEHEAYDTDYGTFYFSVKVGVALGEAQWGILEGENNDGRTYYFRGTAVDQCAAAEHHASGGDLIVASEIITLLGKNQLLADPLDGTEQFVRLTAVQRPLPTPQPLNLPEPNRAHAAAFHSPDLLDWNVRGEFRQVLSMFISLDEIETHAQLVTFMQTVFRLQGQYGGFFNRIDFGDKGCNLLLFFGAPTAHENDIERAANFILDLQAAVNLPLRAGLTYRIAHAGYVGATIREEYTCYGRGVNLAARHMMGAQWGEIWLDEPLAQRLQDEFQLTFTGRLPFKGFAEEQPVYKLIGRAEQIERPLYDRPLIGREIELNTLTTQLHPLTTGNFAGVITIHGEAGTGKSHLLYALQERTAAFEEPAPHWAHAVTDEIVRESLNPFRYWLHGYFQQSREAPEADNRHQFDQTLTQLLTATADNEPLWRELERTRSFLAALVGLTPAENSLYAQVDPALRFRNTLLAVRALIQAESLQRPLILEIEDAQWLDADSPQLLNDLARHLDGYPAAIVMSSREPIPAAWFDEPIKPFTVSLNNLNRDGIKTLMMQFVDDSIKALNDSLIDFVALRTDGNPFFVEQVMLFFREQGLIGGSSLDTLSARFDIPTDIRSVLVARLDRLFQDVKQVVQTAAVLGREFEVQLLAQMINNGGQFNVKLETATEAAIWLPLTQIRYIFKHGLMRDAAYNMQLQARLQELHRLAAVSFETLYAHDLAPYYGDLAYHYGRSGPNQREKTLFYLDLAARKMQAEYANEDALRYYEQALTLETRWSWVVGQIDVLHVLGRREAELAALERLATISDAPQFTVQSLWGRYYEAIGNYDAAEAAVLQALIAQTTRLSQAQSFNQLGLIARRQGAYDKAKGFFEEAAALFSEQPEAAEEVKTYAHIFSGLATIYRQQGEFDTARTHYRQALTVTRDHQQLLEEAMVLNHLGVLDYYQRDFGEAERHHQQALQIRQTIGDRDGMGASLYNIAIVNQDNNEYDQAQKYYAEAQLIWQETQNRWEEVNAWNGLGMLAQQLGQLDLALNALMQGLTISREIGDEAGEAYVLANLGGVYHDLQNLTLAETTYTKGQQFAEAQNDLYMLSYFVSHLGMVHLDAADYPQAIALAESALEMRRTNDLRLWSTADLTTLAAAHLAQKEPAKAREYVTEAVEILDECQGKGPELPQRDYFIAYEVWQALGENTAAQQALAQANRLMQEKAAEITAADTRRSFLEQVPIHKKIRTAVDDKQR